MKLKHGGICVLLLCNKCFLAMNIFKVLTGHTERILGMTISPCGQYVMSASSDESLRLWWCFKVDKSAKLKSATKKSRLVQSVR